MSKGGCAITQHACAHSKSDNITCCISYLGYWEAPLLAQLVPFNWNLFKKINYNFGSLLGPNTMVSQGGGFGSGDKNFDMATNGLG